MKNINRLLKLISLKPDIRVSVNHVSQNNLLEGRCAVVVGGASGIGLAISKKILEAGGKVVIVGRNKDKLKAAEKELNTVGECLGTVICDVMDYKQCVSLPKMVSDVCNNQQIDILVNSAGTNGTIRDFLMITEEEWDIINNTNLKGVFFTTQAFVKEFLEKKQSAHVLNICSVTGLKGAVLPYGISKWGEVGFTKGIAKKYASKGIIVNGIAPGATATKMMGYESVDGDLFRNVPGMRASIPDEIGNLAVFMCSDMGANMVGEVISYDGGERMM